MLRSWTPHDLAELRSRYASESPAALAIRFKRTATAIKSKAKVLGLRRGNRRPWSTKEEATLRRLYPETPTAQIAEQLGRSLTTVYQKAAKLGLLKSEAYLASPAACRLRRGDKVGASYQFPKGHVPANKGLRRPGWAPGRMRETQFKKGRAAHEARNYLPIGSQRLTKDGYLERKVTDDPSIAPARRWIGVHRLVWEAAHGPVPEGRAVAFLPGRRTTVLEQITLDALELVSRAELMRRNSVQNLPPEIKTNVQLLGAITRQINRRTA